MEFYAIECDGRLMTLSTCASMFKDDPVVETELHFCSGQEAPWLTQSLKIAEHVLSGEVTWYNSSLDCPQLQLIFYKNAKIVKMSLTIL